MCSDGVRAKRLIRLIKSNSVLFQFLIIWTKQTISFENNSFLFQLVPRSNIVVTMEHAFPEMPDAMERPTVRMLTMKSNAVSESDEEANVIQIWMYRIATPFRHSM